MCCLAQHRQTKMTVFVGTKKQVTRHKLASKRLGHVLCIFDKSQIFASEKLPVSARKITMVAFTFHLAP